MNEDIKEKYRREIKARERREFWENVLILLLSLLAAVLTASVTF